MSTLIESLYMNRLRILNLEPENVSQSARDRLDLIGEVTYISCRDSKALLNIVHEKPWEIVFTRLGLMFSNEIISRMGSLEVIVTPTTGTDHIALDAAEKNSVQVLSLKGETQFLRSITTTAEHTWGLLLTLTRRMNQIVPDVCAGNWRRDRFKAVELRGMVLGILGLGRLGQIMARYGNAFGMRVQATDCRNSAFLDTESSVKRVSLDELLKSSDVLTVHLPLEDSTKGLLDREKLNSTRQGSYFLNTSRGEIVDEGALTDLIEAGHFSGVGLDVLQGDSSWSEDGPGIEHQLVKLARQKPQLIITPHFGGYAEQAIERTRIFMIEKLENWLQYRGNKFT